MNKLMQLVLLTVLGACGSAVVDEIPEVPEPPPAPDASPPPPPPVENLAPTLAEVPAIVLDEDQPGTVVLAVADAETDAAALAVTVSVADEDLVTLTLAADRTLTLTPAPDRHGATSVMVTVSDGVHQITRTVAVTVSPVNDAPTISDVTNQAVAEDGTTPAIPFVVDDVDLAPALVVTATSSNPTLLPAAGITLAGTGSERTVVLAPAANLSGTATVELTVSDGVASRTDSFVLTVGGANDAPVIGGLADQTTSEDTAKTVSFTVSDVETAAGGLVVSATATKPSLATVTTSGTNGTRSLTITPAANAHGTTTIVVFVTDGTATTQQTISLTVSPVNDAPKIADIANQYVGADGDSGDIVFKVSDVDGDTLVVTGAITDETFGLKLTLGGSGIYRTFRTQGAYHEGGTAKITLTVKDPSGLSAVEAFQVNVKVRITGAVVGTGSVKVSATGCSDTSTCDLMPGAGPITLTASAPVSGHHFQGWSGSCSGTSLSVELDAAPGTWATCTAKYVYVGL